MNDFEHSQEPMIDPRSPDEKKADRKAWGEFRFGVISVSVVVMICAFLLYNLHSRYNANWKLVGYVALSFLGIAVADSVFQLPQIIKVVRGTQRHRRYSRLRLNATTPPAETPADDPTEQQPQGPAKARRDLA